MLWGLKLVYLSDMKETLRSKIALIWKPVESPLRAHFLVNSMCVIGELVFTPDKLCLGGTLNKHDKRKH